MEFISQLFVAFFALFLSDIPDIVLTAVQKPEAVNLATCLKMATRSFLVTLEVERPWSPSNDINFRPRRLFHGSVSFEIS
jgi:hypothetical protein